MLSVLSPPYDLKNQNLILDAFGRKKASKALLFVIPLSFQKTNHINKHLPKNRLQDRHKTKKEMDETLQK